MPQSDMPTMRSRRLGAELRRLREAAGLNMGDAARELQCGQPKISRIEAGLRGIRPLDLDHLMTLYGVADQERREALKRLAKQVHQVDWWSSRGPLLHESLKDYLTLETDSSLIRTYEAQLFPGLLQTEEYMAEIFFRQRPADQAQVMLETRLKRQNILDGAEAVGVRVVLEATVLHRVVGSEAVMADQLDHALRMAQRPNVDLQVLPVCAAIKPDQYTSYSILTTRDAPHVDYVWLEHLTSSTLLEREQDVQRYLRAWDDHTAAAMSPEDSADYIRELMGEYRT